MKKTKELINRFLHTSVRKNTLFKNLDFYLKSQYWPLEKIREHQLSELKKLLWQAHEYVPYYTKLFKRIGFHPEDLKTLEDLSLLPVLTKDDIRNNFEDFLATNLKPPSILSKLNQRLYRFKSEILFTPQL